MWHRPGKVRNRRKEGAEVCVQSPLTHPFQHLTLLTTKEQPHALNSGGPLAPIHPNSHSILLCDQINLKIHLRG